MHTVLITTSGIGSRLGNLTKHLNKSLIRVGNKFAICHIIDNYDLKNTRFIITLGYRGNLVKEFLDIAYENNQFIYVYVDNYENDGSSLVYSLLQAQAYLQCPFTFFCCDSLILDSYVFKDINIESNIMYVAKCSNVNAYASISVANEKILKVHEKGHNEYSYAYTGISYIYDYADYWHYMQCLYDKEKYNKELSDIHVINIMIQNDLEFRYKILHEWYDIGNIDNLQIASKYIKCDYNILHKDDEALCFLDNKVIKFFSDANSLKNRVMRANLLYPKCPEILNVSEHFFSMKYIDGTLLSQYYRQGQIYDLLCWSLENLWLNKHVDDEYHNICMKFYKTKTLERLNQLNIEGDEYHIINGIKILPIKELIECIDWNILTTDTFYNYHGDFILDNIIFTGKTYKLLDWRQDFAGNISHADIYYDLSKLRHNIIFNHDNIENGLYKLELINNEIIIDIKCNYFLMNQLEDYDKFISDNKFDKNKIKILTALIWLNMAPLHSYEISKFLFYFGKYNLALALHNYTRP